MNGGRKLNVSYSICLKTLTTINILAYSTLKGMPGCSDDGDNDDEDGDADEGCAWDATGCACPASRGSRSGCLGDPF